MCLVTDVSSNVFPWPRMCGHKYVRGHMNNHMWWSHVFVWSHVYASVCIVVCHYMYVQSHTCLCVGICVQSYIPVCGHVDKWSSFFLRPCVYICSFV